MAKGNPLRIDPFYMSTNSTQDFLPLASSSSKSASLASSTSVKFPYLRKWDNRDEAPSSKQQKKPLLTLKLSSSSFLETTVNDGLSTEPLYTLKTTSMGTSVTRYDPWEGPTTTADIQWPSQLPVKSKGRENFYGVTVRMNGNTRPVEHFLKYGALSGARSFTVPNYPHTFKWRRSGSSYHCTTTGVKGAVATLDAAVSSVPPRLQVFETLLVQDSRPQLDRGGVSLNLLDHLLVTALLLVTDAEEWVTLAGSGSTSQSVMSIEAPPQSAPASVRQWRKIVYGEPLFPSLRSPDGQADSSPLDEGEDEARPGSSASRPASMRQWRKIVYGEPLFPSLPNQDSPVEGDEPSRSSTPWDDASQSSESVNYPSTPLSTGAPAHGYIDPSFYDSDVPPVPELPTEFKSYSPSPSLRPQSSRQSSSVPTTSSTYSGSRRELPRPPGASTSTSNLRISTSASASTSKSSSTPLNQTWLHRSRSTPFLNNNVPPLSIKRKSGTELSQRSPSSQRAESPVLSLGGSRRRRLPPTPQSNNVPGTSPPVSIVPIRARTEKRRPNSQASSVHRTLPPTPVPRVRPSTSSEVESAAEQYTRQSMEKEANELSEWVQSLTIGDLQQRQNLRPAQTHHEAESAAQSAVFDAPPPAYNAIDFSHPPHASAPPPGDSSEGTPHPCASPIPTLPHSQLSTEA